MIWSKWVEDEIYSLYYEYDLSGCQQSQEKLKKICINELNSHESIKTLIKDKHQLRFFIIQMLLENI